MIYLALGSNLGNRLENLRLALNELSKAFCIKKISPVIETNAILLPESPSNWNLNYLNMMVSGDTDLSPQDLLNFIKSIEIKLGRNMKAERWSPRKIDIDIVMYNDQSIQLDQLTVPHKEISNRNFWKYLLETLGYCTNDPDVNNFKAINYFALSPKLIKIVNVTPDSFSDGGKFFNPDDAITDAEQSYLNGAAYIDLGAQSTRPGYVEIPYQEEIKRLEPVIDGISSNIPLSIDSYFDEVIEFFLNKPNFKIVNDIRSRLSDTTLKKIADNKMKIITMMDGTDLQVLKNQIAHLRNCGLTDIIVDPGLGFGKTKFENIKILQNINSLKDLGCEVLIAHSRKSFCSLFSNKSAFERDIETIAVSDFVAKYGVDYLRVHNLQDHMRFFVAQIMMQPKI